MAKISAEAAAPTQSISGLARYFTPLCYAAVVLSAFLLFQVELIIGKFLLPWFGGAPATWITCLLFFQIGLLSGYSYAHWLTGSDGRTRLHLLFIVLSVALLVVGAFFWRPPIMPGEAWKPYSLGHPILLLLKMLAASVGIPFLILSATSPLLQAWWARLRPAQSAYPLYALSNFGSLLALLSYPVVIEPYLRLRVQGWIWSGAYLIFVLLCGMCAVIAMRSRSAAVVNSSEKRETVPALTRALWIALAACGSAMLLAVTNMICQEVAVVPFLWILPLALYLISFILAFARHAIYRRWFFQSLFGISAVLMLFASRKPALWEIAVYLALLFAACMCCHAELVRLKPSQSNLTSFYLYISLGGAIGSVFVSLIAPQVFDGLWEMPISLIACGAVLIAAMFYDRDSWFYESPAWLPIVLVWGLVLLFQFVGWYFGVSGGWSAYPFVMMVVLSLISLRLLMRYRGQVHRGWFRPVQFFAVAMLGMLTFYTVGQMRSLTRNAVFQARNFFGVLRVSQDGQVLVLKHGRTVHGSQYIDPAGRSIPTSYYLTESGIGLMMREHPKLATQSLRVGLVGLGAGTLAVYGRAGDYYRFYDINPKVPLLSTGMKPLFTFVHDSPAKIEIKIGDARLVMEDEIRRGDKQNFDILVLDAFNSDAIPVHLLTSEAMKIYLKELQDPDGVLAVHISNRSLDLAPVLTGLAREYQLDCATVNFNRPPLQGSLWVLMSRNRKMLETPSLKTQAEFGPPSSREEHWTDDYSNLIRLVKWTK